jgi:hypothetical protein
MRQTSFLLPLILLGLALAAGCDGAEETPLRKRTPAAPATNEGIIVDDQDATVELNGVWREVEVAGAYGGRCLWAPLNPTVPNEYGYTQYDSSGSAYAYVRPDLPQPGTYEIRAHWCAPRAVGEPIATISEIEVHPTRGRVAYTPVQVNMTQPGDAWVSLGRFYLEEDGLLIVSNAAGPNNGAVVFDAFQFIFRTSEREEAPPAGPLQPPPPQPSPTPTG